MNFDKDYQEFIVHLAKKGGSKPVRLNRREDVSVRLFVAYLNLRYEKARAPSAHINEVKNAKL